MDSITIDADPWRRTAAFLGAFIDALEGADIEIREAMTDDGKPSLAISIDGPIHCFTVEEARKVANAAEVILGQYPDLTSLADLAMALRSSADALERPE